VTQQFNTTSSMGRLTLNVLLSFAQFERDVMGERIRDKIAASKKKGTRRLRARSVRHLLPGLRRATNLPFACSGAAQHCRRSSRSGESTMSSHSAPVTLAMHLALLSCISFGGFPSVLPDLHNLVVAANGWVTDQEFTNFFALAQVVPGPNMILLMSFIGWKVGEFPARSSEQSRRLGRPAQCILRPTSCGIGSARRRGK